jgi:hypothetical protein
MRNRYPDDDVAWPETTRQVAALRQISAASAITLASAAEGVMPDAEEGESLFQDLKKRSDKNKKSDVNFVQNSLKHGKYDGCEIEEMKITPFLAAVVLWRAITKFVTVYQKETPEMEEFMVWSREIGYPAPTRGVP